METLLAIGHLIHGIARLAQPFAQMVGDFTIVFDDEYAHGSGDYGHSKRKAIALCFAGVTRHAGIGRMCRVVIFGP